MEDKLQNMHMDITPHIVPVILRYVCFLFWAIVLCSILVVGYYSVYQQVRLKKLTATPLSWIQDPSWKQHNDKRKDDSSADDSSKQHYT